jgi:hypothetical protein
VRLIVRWSVRFLTFGFFFIAIVVTSMKSLDYSPLSFMLLIRCVIRLRSSSPSNLRASTGTSAVTFCHLLVSHLLRLVLAF